MGGLPHTLDLTPSTLNRHSDSVAAIRRICAGAFDGYNSCRLRRQIVDVRVKAGMVSAKVVRHF